jgi:hypothetical protein
MVYFYGLVEWRTKPKVIFTPGEKTMKKKLVLNKQTVADLTKKEQSQIKAGAYKPCWENLYTWYHCDVVCTGKPDETENNCETDEVVEEVFFNQRGRGKY